MRGETETEMARRHVREATERLARQEALIATRLERFSDPRVIRLGIDLLETLRMTVSVARRHLEIVESMRREPGQPGGDHHFAHAPDW